jgi:hypothetical protein
MILGWRLARKNIIDPAVITATGDAKGLTPRSELVCLFVERSRASFDFSLFAKYAAFLEKRRSNDKYRVCRGMFDLGVWNMDRLFLHKQRPVYVGHAVTIAIAALNREK